MSTERRVVAGHELIMIDTGSGIEMWLDTTVADFDGLCIASGATRAAVIAEALQTLEYAMEAVRSFREPPERAEPC